jgi:hypothetical protein
MEGDREATLRKNHVELNRFAVAGHSFRVFVAIALAH